MQGITEIQHVTGYLAYWDELRRRFPNLLIDTCAPGGRRLDLETLRRSVPLWRSDYAYEPASMQQFTYGLSFWIPYFGTGFNSANPYIFWSPMTPAAGIGLDVPRIEAEAERLRQLAGQWRSIAQSHYGDLYPMTPYETGPDSWMARQFDSTRGGMAQAFRRPESPFETARFRLRGLEPNAVYRVRDIAKGTESRHKGWELMQDGPPVSMRSRPAAAGLAYRRE